MDFIANADFLKMFAKGDQRSFILIGETHLIDARLSQLGAEQQAIIEEKRIVAEQSGDNWHDGAFIATDNAALAVSEQAMNLVRARDGIVVEPPDLDSESVSLGSAVGVRQGSDRYTLVIVGIATLFPPSNDHEYCSLASPIAQELIGGRIGSIVKVDLESRQSILEILSIDQSKIRYLLENSADRP